MTFCRPLTEVLVTVVCCEARRKPPACCYPAKSEQSPALAAYRTRAMSGLKVSRGQISEQVQRAEKKDSLATTNDAPMNNATLMVRPTIAGSSSRSGRNGPEKISSCQGRRRNLRD